jgi:REP element-mobilizing transposase RayT
MASHQQLLYHIVFSTKERRLLLREDDFRDSVWRYMAGIASNLQGHAVRIGGYYDHAHLLLRIPGKIAVADFVRQLKANTSKHINEIQGSRSRFHWQDGPPKRMQCQLISTASWNTIARERFRKST